MMGVTLLGTARMGAVPRSPKLPGDGVEWDAAAARGWLTSCRLKGLKCCLYGCESRVGSMEERLGQGTGLQPPRGLTSSCSLCHGPVC